MSLAYEILGQPGIDNALLVTIDTGQRIVRLLFDCGANCLGGLPSSRIKAIDALFFSHLHMDHVAGFDDFFRPRYDLPDRPNRVFGPPGTAAILQHRFRGYFWNLHAELKGVWQVHDIHSGILTGHRFHLHEAFAIDHEMGDEPYTAVVYGNDCVQVEAILLQHHGPCCGYLVREKAQLNVNVERLRALGLPAGPWVRHVKENTGPETLHIDGRAYSREALRAELCSVRPGRSLAYLTDFLLDESTFATLRERIRGCDTVVCESQYRASDAALAEKHHHTTVDQVARLAAAAEIGELILFHISDRYTPAEWREMLGEARTCFSPTRFPETWQLVMETGEPADAASASRSEGPHPPPTGG